MLNITTEDLPAMIHGKEGSGASYFSIQIIAQMAKNKIPIVFWSAYSAAKVELRKTLDGNLGSNVHIIENGDFAELGLVLKNIEKGSVLFVKNFETVPKELRESILDYKLSIIAGDLEKALIIDQVLNFPMRIFFSKYAGIAIPPLGKYEGFMFSKSENGIVKV